MDWLRSQAGRLALSPTRPTATLSEPPPRSNSRSPERLWSPRKSDASSKREDAAWCIQCAALRRISGSANDNTNDEEATAMPGESWAADDATVDQCLRELWNAYKSIGALGGMPSDAQVEPPQSSTSLSAEDHLRGYLSTFNGFHASGSARHDIYANADNANLVSHEGHAYAIERRYPAACLQHLVTAALPVLFARNDHALVFQLFQHVELMAGASPLNRHLFVDHLENGVLTMLLQVAFAVADREVDGESHNCAIMIAFAALLQHLVDDQQTWKEWLITWSNEHALASGSSFGSERSGRDSSRSPRSPISQDMVSALSPGSGAAVVANLEQIIAWVLHVVDRLVDIPGGLSPRQYSLAIQCLNLVGSLLVSERWAGNSLDLLSMSNARARLQRFVRWPLFLDLVVEPGATWREIATIVSASPNLDARQLRTEFRLQMLVLHLVLMMMHRRRTLPYHGQVIANSDNWCIPTLVAWVTCFSGVFASDEESYVGLNAYPLVPSFLAEIAKACCLTESSTMKSSGEQPHQRNNTKQLQLVCPLASQELDLVVRLLLSYAVHDLQATGGALSGADRCWRWALKEIRQVDGSQRNLHMTEMFEQWQMQHSNFAIFNVYRLNFLQTLVISVTDPTIGEREEVFKAVLEDLAVESLGKQATTLIAVDARETTLATIPAVKITSAYRAKVTSYEAGVTAAIVQTIMSHSQHRNVVQVLVRRYLDQLKDGTLSTTFILAAFQEACTINRLTFASVLLHEPDSVDRLLTMHARTEARNIFDELFLDQPTSTVTLLLDYPGSCVKLLGNLFDTDEVLARWSRRHVMNLLMFHAQTDFKAAAKHEATFMDHFFQQLLGLSSDRLSQASSLLEDFCKVIRAHGRLSRFAAHLTGNCISTKLMYLLQRAHEAPDVERCSLVICLLRTFTAVMVVSLGSNSGLTSDPTLLNSVVEVLSKKEMHLCLRDPAVIDVLCGMCCNREVWQRDEVVRNPHAIVATLRLMPFANDGARAIVIQRLHSLLNCDHINLARVTEVTGEMVELLLLGDTFDAGCDESDTIVRLRAILLRFATTTKIARGVLRKFQRCLRDNADQAGLLHSLQLALNNSPRPRHMYNFALSGIHSGIVLSPMKVAAEDGYTLAMRFRVATLDVTSLSWRAFDIRDADTDTPPTSYAPRLFSCVSGSRRWEAFLHGGILRIAATAEGGNDQEIITNFKPDLGRWYSIAFVHHRHRPNKLIRTRNRRDCQLYVDGKSAGEWRLDYPPAYEFEHCSVGAFFRPVDSAERTCDNLQQCLAGDVADVQFMNRCATLDDIKRLSVGLSTAVDLSVGDIHLHPRAFDSGTCFNASSSNTSTIGLLHNGVHIMQRWLPEALGACDAVEQFVELLRTSTRHHALVISVIAVLVRNHPRSVRSFKTMDGCRLIMHLLRVQDRQSLSPSIVSTLATLVTAFEDDIAREDAFRDVWLDFDFWKGTDGDTVVAFSEQLRHLYDNNRDIHSLSGVQALCTQMDVYFQPPTATDSSTVWVVRQNILSAIESVLRMSSTGRAASELLQLLIAASFPQTTLELINIFRRSLHGYDERVRKLVAEVLQEGPTLGSLLQHPNDQIRLASLDTVALLSSHLEHGRVLHAMKHAVSQYALTQETINAIESIAEMIPGIAQLAIYWASQILEIDSMLLAALLVMAKNCILLHQEHVMRIFGNGDVWVPQVAHLLSAFHGDHVYGDHYELTLAITASIYVQLARHVKYAWRMVEEVAIAFWSESTRRAKGTPVMKDLMHRIFQSIVCDPMAVQSPTMKHNTICLICFVEELTFYFREYSSAVARLQRVTVRSKVDLNKLRQGSSSSIVSVASSMDGDSADSWQDLMMIQLLVQASELFGLVDIDSTTEAGEVQTRLRGGGIFRILVRILLHSLLNDDLASRNMAARRLNELLMKYSPISLTDKSAVLFMRQRTEQRLLYIIGHVSEARNANLTEITNETSETGDLLLGLITRWKDLVPGLTVVDDALVSNKSDVWTAAAEQLLTDAIKTVEAETDDLLTAAKKRFTTSAKTALAQWQILKELEGRERDLHLQNVAECYRQLTERRTTAELEAVEHLRTLQRRLGAVTERNVEFLSRPNGCNYLEAERTASRRWTLDFVENYRRMHLKFLPNFNFNDHADASRSRDHSEHPLSSESSDDMAGKLPLVALRRPSLNSLNTSEHMDDWDLATDTDPLFADDFSVLTVECEMVALMATVKGSLEITKRHVKFTVDKSAALTAAKEAGQQYNAFSQKLLVDRQWSLADLHECWPRRHLLRCNALELFFLDRTSVFFSFPSGDYRPVLKRITQCKPPNLIPAVKPLDYLTRQQITERWRRRELSNFDYLMTLNSVAGRSHNDLTQYPVFPWILTDYTSPTLDLNDPTIYRDLFKPVGALNDIRLQTFIERYDSLDKSFGIPRFHYGTHYSSAASVLFYLLRVEPFTTLHIELQNGKFDHADRQFHDLAATWRSCLETSGDVKELIPEFFYMPEMFRNENGFDLGRKQTGTVLGDVVLPPWAKTPEEFVHMHRMALESDYVSEHLDEWIDLIFGFKQTGEEARKAHNVFYYLTYEGAIDLQRITDPATRRSIESQITHFGQTPLRLFSRKHPKRQRAALAPVPRTIFQTELLVDYTTCSTPLGVEQALALLNVEESSAHNVMVLLAESSMASLRFTWAPVEAGLPFAMEVADRAERAVVERVPFASRDRLYPPFALKRRGGWAFVANALDGSVFARSIGFGTQGKPTQVISAGEDMDDITTIALSAEETFLGTGYANGVVIIWTLGDSTNTKAPPTMDVKHRLHGHDSAIRSIAVSEEYDLVVSVSAEQCFLYQLKDGTCLHRICLLPANMDRVEVLPSGRLALFTSEPDKERACHSYSMHLFTVNARPVLMASIRDRVITCHWNEETVDGGSTSVIMVHEHAVDFYRISSTRGLMLEHHIPYPKDKILTSALTDDRQVLCLIQSPDRLIVLTPKTGRDTALVRRRASLASIMAMGE